MPKATDPGKGWWLLVESVTVAIIHPRSGSGKCAEKSAPDLDFTLDDIGAIGYYPDCSRRVGQMMSFGHWMAPCRGSCAPCVAHNFRLANFRLRAAIPEWKVPAYRYGNLTAREVQRFSNHSSETDDAFVVVELRKSGRYEVISTRRVKGLGSAPELDVTPAAMAKYVRELSERRKPDAHVHGSDHWWGQKRKASERWENRCSRRRFELVAARWKKYGFTFANDKRRHSRIPNTGNLNAIQRLLWRWQVGYWERAEKLLKRRRRPKKLASNKRPRKNKL